MSEANLYFLALFTPFPPNYGVVLFGTPFNVTIVPSGSKGVPFGLKGVPSGLKGVPSVLKGVPFALKGIPSGLKGVPFGLEGTPSIAYGCFCMSFNCFLTSSELLTSLINRETKPPVRIIIKKPAIPPKTAPLNPSK